MPRPALSTTLTRGLKLRCPRCGEGRLYESWWRMRRGCADCGLKYERAPGYFLGAAYINYGLTSVSLTIAYVGLHFGAGLDNETLFWPLGLYCVGFPLACLRHARSMWMAMDSYIDFESFEAEHD
ncbi:MAG: DUF983 domain-containing protein [Planctomycetaceae bacterium]